MRQTLPLAAMTLMFLAFVGEGKRVQAHLGGTLDLSVHRGVEEMSSELDSLHFNMQSLDPVSDKDNAIIQRILNTLGPEWQWSNATDLGPFQPGYGPATDILDEQMKLAFAKHLLHGHGWNVLIGKARLRQTAGAATTAANFESLTMKEHTVAWEVLGKDLQGLSKNGLANLHAFDHNRARESPEKWFRDEGELQVMHSPSSMQWIQGNGIQGRDQAQSLATQLGQNLRTACGPRAQLLFPCKGKGRPNDDALLSTYYAWEEAQFIADFFKFWKKKNSPEPDSDSDY